MQSKLFQRGFHLGAALCLIAASGCSGGKVQFPWQKTAQVAPGNAQVAQAAPASSIPPYSQVHSKPTANGPLVGQNVAANTAQHPEAGKPLVDDPNVKIPDLPVLQHVQFGPLQ